MILLILQTTLRQLRTKGDRLIPVGAAISISVEADGVLVVGLSQLDTHGKDPTYDAGLRQGDIITMWERTKSQTPGVQGT